MKHEAWWKKSVIYQIYPKSFQDDNHDGIGDLKGVINRLPYLEKLGITVIWLSPCYQSPMDDGGYDISDYYEIDSIFGSMADMDELIATAKKHGIKLLMDLVINHTSDEHKWFKEALADPKSKYRDYYIFREGKDGKAPNNWRSYFGGSAWEKVPNEENMYFLHAFSKRQPDLNWENTDMREAIIDMINWWLEKGLGGFRVDAILNLKKPTNFYKSYPADAEDGLSSISKYIANQPGILDWLHELDDRCFKKYNAFTVSEADVPDRDLIDYVGPNGVFSTTFDFSYSDIALPSNGAWYMLRDWTVVELRERIFNHQLKAQKIGWGVQYLENHDQPRSISKYIPEADRNDTSKKLLATLFMMLHGTPFIYQGQEIGMENITTLNLDDYDDIATYEMYDRALIAGLSKKEAFDAVVKRSRDNSRTPMQWSSEPHAGFSTAHQTWLKINPNYTTINVASQEHDTSSVLSYYKKLIDLRKAANPYSEVTIFGEFVPVVYNQENIIAYQRVLNDQALLILINLSNESVVVDVDKTFKYHVLDNLAPSKIEDGELVLKPYQSIILANYI
ncbi:MAG: alpha-glucosidase [Lactococcus plantarum]|nr:alpha-glucosidase [Lactococcus plantarum]MDN6084996.1 alpha-glucosidase [Lactococcus plantarum]